MVAILQTINFTETCSNVMGPIGNKSTLVQIMAWRHGRTTCLLYNTQSAFRFVVSNDIKSGIMERNFLLILVFIHVLIHPVHNKYFSVQNNKSPGRPMRPINRLDDLKSIWDLSENWQKRTAHYLKGPPNIERTTQPFSICSPLGDQHFFAYFTHWYFQLSYSRDVVRIHSSWCRKADKPLSEPI